MRQLKTIFRWVHLLLITITLLSYLSPFIHPSIFWPLAVLGLSYPVLLVLNIFFFLFWLFLKDKYLFFALGTIILGWSHLTALIGFNGKQETSPTLRITSFNCHGIKVWSEKDRVASEDDIMKVLGAQAPDILCLQEYPSHPIPIGVLRQAVRNKLGLKYEAIREGGTLAIFSKYPIAASQNHYYKNGANGYQWADVQIENQTIRIFNLHLQSNALTQMAEKVMDEGKLQEKSTWLNIRGMIGRYRRAAVLRSEQAEEINTLLKRSPHPVILGGDFNEPPTSYAYHTLRKHLKDAFQEAGRGIGVTYAGKVPGLRIDYILTDPSFTIVDYDILPYTISDHRAVAVGLKLPSEGTIPPKN